MRVWLPGENGREANLHSVWDTPLVEVALGPFTVEDWVVEGYKIAREKVYQDKGAALPGPGGDRHTLTADYMLDGAAVVEARLTRAGLRLAQFLNDTFKE